MRILPHTKIFSRKKIVSTGLSFITGFNHRVPCNALPEINLELWKERVACNVGGTTIQTGDAKRVSPCTMCTCTKEGPLCQSLKVENCFHLAQSFTRSAILNDHVCKVQCAFAFRAFPNVRTGENKIGFS